MINIWPWEANVNHQDSFAIRKRLLTSIVLRCAKTSKTIYIYIYIYIYALVYKDIIDVTEAWKNLGNFMN